MHETLQQLIHLTEIDALIVQTREQLDAYPGLLAEMKSAETRLAKALESARAEAEAATHDRRAAEREVNDLRERIQKFTLQQSRVKTNKEYEALTHEIDALKAKIDGLDTVGLAKLEAEEDAAARIEQGQAKLAALNAEHTAEHERIQTQTAEKTERLERLQAERQSDAAALDPDLLYDYELENERYPGSVCAPLTDDHCGACNFSLVLAVRQAVRRGGELIRCGHCRRFLYQK